MIRRKAALAEKRPLHRTIGLIYFPCRGSSSCFDFCVSQGIAWRDRHSEDTIRKQGRSTSQRVVWHLYLAKAGPFSRERGFGQWPLRCGARKFLAELPSRPAPKNLRVAHLRLVHYYFAGP